MKELCRTNHVSNKKKIKNCNDSADMLYMGTTMFGNKAFLDSQKNACDCVPSTKNEL